MGYDPIDLRPATVEELAAQERGTIPRHRHRRRDRRPAVIFLATAALLIAGASALALARNDPPPLMVQPAGSDAPFGVGYEDGFGEHSFGPTPPSASKRPKVTTTATAIVVPSILDSRGVQVSPFPPVSPPPSARMTAVRWAKAGNGRFEAYIWVHNEGSAPGAWEVRVLLPEGATVTESKAVNRTFVDGAWVFTSTRGHLGAGLVYLFVFSGTTGSAAFSLKSCTVNGSPCDPFR